MSDDFRALLRRYRDRHHWSQERLAFEAEMDHSLVSRLESGQRPPTREAIAKLCGGLDLTAADADALWLASGYLPPDIVGREISAATIDLWRIMGRLEDQKRATVENLLRCLIEMAQD